MRSLISAFAAAAFLCGCDTAPRADYSGLNLVDVTGTVTLDGEPLPDAVITFDEPDGRSFSYARTDSAGGYTMRFDSDVNGVLPGPKRVRISTTRSIVGLEPPGQGEADGLDEAEDAGGEEAFGPTAEELVPARYRGADSELAADVSDEADTFDFDLTSD